MQQTNTLSTYWITMFRYKTSLFILCQHKHPSFDEGKECLIVSGRSDVDSFVAQVQEEVKAVQQEITAFNMEGQKIQGTSYHWKNYETDFDLLGHHHLATDLTPEQCRNKVDALEQEKKEYRAKLKLERQKDKERKAQAKAQALGATPAQAPANQASSSVIENVTGEQCKKCSSPIIFCCDSIGKLQGKTILLGRDKCPNCGLLPIPKRQKQLYQKISASVTNLKKLRSSQVNKLADGELAYYS